MATRARNLYWPYALPTNYTIYIVHIEDLKYLSNLYIQVFSPMTPHCHHLAWEFLLFALSNVCFILILEQFLDCLDWFFKLFAKF